MLKKGELNRLKMEENLQVRILLLTLRVGWINFDICYGYVGFSCSRFLALADTFVELEVLFG